MSYHLYFVRTYVCMYNFISFLSILVRRFIYSHMLSSYLIDVFNVSEAKMQLLIALCICH